MQILLRYFSIHVYWLSSTRKKILVIYFKFTHFQRERKNTRFKSPKIQSSSWNVIVLLKWCSIYFKSHTKCPHYFHSIIYVLVAYFDIYVVWYTISKHRITLKFSNWTFVIQCELCDHVFTATCSCTYVATFAINDGATHSNSIGIKSKHSGAHSSIVLMDISCSRFFSMPPLWMCLTFHWHFQNWYCHIHKIQVTRKYVEKNKVDCDYISYRLPEALSMCILYFVHTIHNTVNKYEMLHRNGCCCRSFLLLFLYDLRIFTEIFFKWHWQPITWHLIRLYWDRFFSVLSCALAIYLVWN